MYIFTLQLGALEYYHLTYEYEDVFKTKLKLYESTTEVKDKEEKFTLGND